MARRQVNRWKRNIQRIHWFGGKANKFIHSWPIEAISPHTGGSLITVFYWFICRPKNPLIGENDS